MRLFAHGIDPRVILAACLAAFCHASQSLEAADGETRPKAFRCRFVNDTLVPQLAMGVRRLDGDRIDVLEVRREPRFSAPVAVEKPLFRPFFVVDSRADSDGQRWHLLQDGYATDTPLGWVPQRHLHLMDSRYGYTFAVRQPEQLADLHDDSKEGYERLLAQLQGNNAGGAETVVVKEAPGAEHWKPSTIDDTVPFVELRIPPADRNREYPDTTPTFRFGIPVENRLVHMGAVCGGPRDDEKLRQLKNAVVVDGMEMLFVVDETVSMGPFNQVVADFINTAGQLAVGRPVPVRIGVCSYSDGPPGNRTTIGDLRVVRGPDDVRELAEKVAELGETLPDGRYSNPPERMLEGLRDALAKITFQPGTTVFVAVVGDTGHEPQDPDKDNLVREVAKLIAGNSARLYFMHVGRRKTADDKLFQEDSTAVRREAERLGVPGDRIVYQPAEQNDLKDALERARREVEDERRRLRWMIARIESRSPYTEPGPKLLKAMESRGLTRGQFDVEQLQYFVPSRGWLFHPTLREQAAATPQFRELFFLTGPERLAVTRLLERIRSDLDRGEPIDGNAMITRFAADLAEAAGSTSLAAHVSETWNQLPHDRRSVGVFLEDVFGLRLKAAIPFPATAYTKDVAASREEIERMKERISRLDRSISEGGDAVFWFDASDLTP